MKKGFVIAVAVICVTVIFSSVFVPFATDNTKDTDFECENSVSDRLLNMLNHNFVYGEDFSNADTVINDSVCALLKYREGDFIREDIIKGFVNNMYGIDVVDFSGLNAEFPQKTGYIYVIPKGFTSYRHSNIKISENEDETFSAKTTITVTEADGTVGTYSCISLFAPNENSKFGFSIISSEILTDTAM